MALTSQYVNSFLTMRTRYFDIAALHGKNDGVAQLLSRPTINTTELQFARTRKARNARLRLW